MADLPHWCPAPVSCRPQTREDVIGGSRRAGRSRDLQGPCRAAQSALVDGAAGAVWAPGEEPRVVFGFTIARGKIVAIDMLADPVRLGQLDLVILS